METLLPLLIAGVAAIAILLIFVGLAGGSPVDPVQARLTQLGTMQAKNLEELELQQPFIERTLRPIAQRLSGATSRGSRARRSPRPPRSASRSPATPATCASADWLGIKAVGAIVGALHLRPAVRRRRVHEPAARSCGWP